MERRVGVGVGAVVRRGGELLLVRREGVHSAGTWSTPGGYLDFGESPDAAATREVFEETGVVVGTPIFIGVTNDVFDGEEHHVCLWFSCNYMSGEARVNAPDEIAEVRWCLEDELPNPLFLPFQNLLAGRFLATR